MTIRKIELKNCDTAVYGDVIYTAKGNRYDPIPPLLRQLTAEQRILPDDIVEIRRGATLCFKPCAAKLWAKFDTVDDPRDGLVRRPAYVGSHLAAGATPGQHSRRRGTFRDERRVAEAEGGPPG
jgi:hypothetical protein